MIGYIVSGIAVLLALEGLLYTLGSMPLVFALILVTALVAGPQSEWNVLFFTHRFTVWPIGVILLLFAILGIAIPVMTCRVTQRYSVVERLRVE